MVLLRIEAGEFMMGSPDSDKDAEDDEKPPHRVRITRPFYLGKYEVTQAEYEAVMGQNPSHFKGKPKNPVESVSWLDAVRFCNQLSEREGLKPFYEISGETVQVPDWNVRGIACRRKRSGNTPVARGRRRVTPLAMMVTAWVSSPGSEATRVAEPMRWVRSVPMPLAYMTCMGTSGSGVGTGILPIITRSRLWTTRGSLTGLVPGDPRRGLELQPPLRPVGGPRQDHAGLPEHQPGLPRGPSPVRRLSFEAGSGWKRSWSWRAWPAERRSRGAEPSRPGPERPAEWGMRAFDKWGFRDSGPRSGLGRAL